MLGRMHGTSEGLVLDLTEAARLCRCAAKHGLGAAMYDLARCLENGGGYDADPVQAVQWMRRAVELGEADAQAELALCYSRGECGRPVNYKDAHRLARLGADQGHAFAMTNIGLLFGRGWGVAQDLDEAFKWYRQAALLGNDVSKNNIRGLARAGHALSLAAVRELGLGPL